MSCTGSRSNYDIELELFLLLKLYVVLVHIALSPWIGHGGSAASTLDNSTTASLYG